MATMLYEKDSSERHLKATRRHMRRCKLVKGADKYATTITPFYNNLIGKINARTMKVEASEDAYDYTLFYDSELDTEVKIFYHECDKYDQKNPGALTLKKIFPEGKITTFTMVHLVKEVGLVKQLILRLESLGTDHALAAFGQELKEKLNDAENSITTYHAALSEEKIARGEESIAKRALGNQYEKNYLEARGDLGKIYAEKLFSQRTKKTAPKEAAA